MSKLQNMKAVRELLSGTHKTQTKTFLGYQGKKDVKLREVGEVWEEVLPNGNIIQWEQKKGYRVKMSKNLKELSDLRQSLYNFSKCEDSCEKKTTKKYSKYDQQCSTYYNRCLDCYAKFETTLKIEGKWESFQKDREYRSLLAWLKDAEIEKEIIKTTLNTVEYVEESGDKEKWIVENKEELLSKIDSDFEKLKQDLLKPFEDEVV